MKKIKQRQSKRKTSAPGRRKKQLITLEDIQKKIAELSKDWELQLG